MKAECRALSTGGNEQVEWRGDGAASGQVCRDDRHEKKRSKEWDKSGEAAAEQKDKEWRVERSREAEKQRSRRKRRRRDM